MAESTVHSAANCEATHPHREALGQRRQALAHVPAFFYKYHPADMQVLFASDYITELSGFERELFTADPTRWIAHVDRGVISLKALEAFRYAVRQKKPFDVVFLFHTAHRGPRWFQAAGVPSIEHGKLYYYGSVIDVTEKRAAETARNQLVTAINQAAEAFVITDITGRIQYVNAAFERMSGYSSGEALGQTPNILKSGRHEPGFYQELWQTILSGETWRGRFINKRKDGEFYEQWSTISPLRGEGNVITGFVAIQFDMAPQLEMERRLAQAELMASVGEAISGAAHGIKNILNTLKGCAYMIDLGLAEDDPEKIREVWEVYSRSTSRLEQLTGRMLDYVRISEPQLEPVDLNGLAREILESCRSMAEKAGVTPGLEAAPDLPAVYCDRAAMQDAILNLVSNAVDACVGQPDARVLLRTSRATADQSIRFEVEDNGPGIPAERLEQIFRPFFSTKGHKGNGLGLPLVQKTIEAHHGTIRVESQPGRTRFIMSFPLGQPPPAI